MLWYTLVFVSWTLRCVCGIAVAKPGAVKVPHIDLASSSVWKEAPCIVEYIRLWISQKIRPSDPFECSVMFDNMCVMV